MTPVEAHPCKANFRLARECGVANEHDVTVARQHVSCPLGEPALQTHVHSRGEVRDGEVRGLPGVEEYRSDCPPAKDVVHVEQCRRLLVQKGVALAIRPSVEAEVAGPSGLTLGDCGDEGVLGQVPERVVRPFLLPDRGSRLRGQRLPARRAGTVGRIYPRRVREEEELVAKRAIELACENFRREARTRGCQEVGSADIAHEERVPREHRARFGVFGVLPCDDADGLRSVTGSREDLEGDLTEREAPSVFERLDGKVHIGSCSVRDDSARAVRQLEVSAQEVGVDVSLDDPLDAKVPIGRFLEIDADVASRVHDHRPPGRLVADQLGGVRETRKVVLGEDHPSAPGASA